MFFSYLDLPEPLSFFVGSARGPAPTNTVPLAMQHAGNIMHQLRSRYRAPTLCPVFYSILDLPYISACSLTDSHAMLATAMETMIDEIVTRLKPTPEEELLRTLQVCLCLHTPCLPQSGSCLVVLLHVT